MQDLQTARSVRAHLKGDTLKFVISTNRRFACLVAVLALVTSLCSCSASSSTKAASKSSRERKPAPEFTLTDANGSSVKLSDYRGKVVLLNFWATWCGPCTLEIPWFIEFEQEYKSRGLEVVGISMDDDGWAAVKPYVSEHKMNYRVLMGDDSVSQLYGGVDALPTSFIIDRDGNIASVHVGLAGKDEYLEEIRSLLGEKQTGLSRAGVHSLPAALLISTAK
jgi:peroxiredoxin